MAAPTGRKANVSVMVAAISTSELCKVRAMLVRHSTTRKKSKASSAQLRKPTAVTLPTAQCGGGDGRGGVPGPFSEDSPMHATIMAPVRFVNSAVRPA